MTARFLRPRVAHVACTGQLPVVLGCCRVFCLVLKPNLANQIGARITLVDKDGVRRALEDDEEGGTLYHGYVEGEERRGAKDRKMRVY